MDSPTADPPADRRGAILPIIALLLTSSALWWWCAGESAPPRSIPLVTLLSFVAGVAGTARLSRARPLTWLLSFWLTLLLSGIIVVTSITGYRSVAACTGAFATPDPVTLSRSYSLLTDDLQCRNERDPRAELIVMRGWAVLHGRVG